MFIILNNIYDKIVNDINDNMNYLILDDNVELKTSYNNLLNHIFYLPENYDYCQLYESHKYPFKIINQHNSLYYNVKKYFFECHNSSIVSKKGVLKILNYINNLIPYHFENLIYECYNNIDDFQFYTIKDNQLFSLFRHV